MSEARENVLDKLDALLKKHSTTEPDIPVLTDLVEQPRVDLNVIPVLTEEIVASAAFAEVTPMPEPTSPIELDLVHESTLETSVPPHLETAAVLARLEAVEAEVHAEIEARIAQMQTRPKPLPSIEIPPQVNYVALATTAPPAKPSPEPTPLASTPLASTPPPSATLPPEALIHITAMIEADVARIIKNSLHQTLSEKLPGMVNSALDKALSSMLEQFMMHLEEVVRSSIEDELKKQLAPFKRPPPPTKP